MEPKNALAVFAIFIFSVALSFCQETGYKNFPAQFSFVYPIGTSGLRSVDYSYNFSLNALTGSTGGVRGIEIGGLINYNKGSMLGFQAGGIGNITSGNVEGMQVGGIFCLADSLNGFQAGGILCKATEVRGFQAGGIGSISFGNLEGLQAGGIIGLADSISGLQINGILSRSRDVRGLQVSGIIGLSESADAAISGIANINEGNTEGIQIAGIFNRTKELNGIQIGLINTADTVKSGISIGLIDIVNKGFYDEWTISAADYLNVSLSYKAGTKTFYNIYSLGMNFTEEPLWVTGLGFGHLREISEKYSFQPELICYTYFPLDFEQIRDTYITHLKFGFVYNISRKLSVSFAPGIYAALKSDEGKFDEYGYEQSLLKPVIESLPGPGKTKFEMGFGFGLGLSIK